ncbi:MAG TPA: methyltransferase domain-containing protein [Actinomycetota bacterium]|nr:methyltransferase domain-containing protein [Actinomycetota bacterium]
MGEGRQLRFGEYMLGLEGLALLRMGALNAVDGAPRRVEEMLDLAARLDEPALAASRYLPASESQPGYDVWANTYDERDNPLIRTEEPALLSLLEELVDGAVLDAACGTGRLTGYLVERHRVIGIDNSPAMLARARQKFPEVSFVDGDLSALPLRSASVNSAVSALALSHLPELSPAVSELARVVAPGGRVVISNVHPIVTGVLGWRAWFAHPDGSRSFIPEYVHNHAAYIDAFRSSGLEILRCLEPPIPAKLARAMGGGVADDAAEVAVTGLPGALIWELGR